MYEKLAPQNLVAIEGRGGSFGVGALLTGD